MPIVILLSTLLFILSTTYFGAQRWYIEQNLKETWFAFNPNYKTIETPHFVIKYSLDEKEKAQIIAVEAEKIYKPVTSIFHLQSPKKTMIVLTSYPQEKLKVGQLMTGYANWGVIHIYDDPRDRVPFRTIVAHEFSHVMIRHKYNGAYQFPAWLDEGIAFNVEISITGNKIKSDDDWDEEKNYTIENLEKLNSFTELNSNPDIIYPQCSGIIGYIVETYGENALFQILAKIDYDHKSFAEAVQSTLYIDVPTLDNNGHQYFRNKFYIEGSFRKYALEQK